MEMCYDVALVMPKNYAVVSDDEMTYVDGGYYMNHDECLALAGALCITAAEGAPAIAAAISAAGGAGLSAIAGSVPVLGWVVGLVGAGYLIFQAKEFSEALCTALVYDKGVDITIGFYWFVPKLKFTAC